MTVFALPPGVDFPAALVDGLIARFGHRTPEAFARIQIFLNTRRMQRRVTALFADRGPMLLPRIRLITDLGHDLVDPGLPPSAPPIRRRLELARLVSALLDADPELAPRAALYDLADTLAALLDEMQGEGVGRDDIARIDTTDTSDHWRRRRAFIEIVLSCLDGSGAPDPELRQRLAVANLAERWSAQPPADPVIVAGSTGSRGTTAAFMELVASLPEGHLVLPGFDFDLPAELWPQLEEGLAAEDHPQYRFRSLLKRIGIPEHEVERWTEADPPSSARNRLVSLALRPAPVTHQWLTDGPSLGDLGPATEGLALVVAPSPHVEALAIAVRLRKAVEDGTPAALITPDRMLTRRVAAQLDRWGIVPDDSAGQPLALSPPGRFLRHVAALFGQKLTAEALLILLKHPLAHGVGDERGSHLLHTRDLELFIRRRGVPYPSRAALESWTENRPDRQEWLDWVFATLDDLEVIGTRPLVEQVHTLLGAAGRIATAPGGCESGGLWDEAAGRKARGVMEELHREAVHGAEMSPDDFRNLLHGVLDQADVRDPVTPHPGVMIWGTIEARVQGADLVILAGLNEGVWPALPDPDPWLNRQMRKDAGLLLPEREIGLAAHDFQQAIAARTVILSRAARDAEAETVPSRWLNRLTNLLSGLETGSDALRAMKARGQELIDLAAAVDPVGDDPRPEPQPSPRPPYAARPRQLSVTQVRTLIRDPYAIYAREILGLRPVNALRPEPDAPLRGTVLHDIFEEFVRDWRDELPRDAVARLLAIADRKLLEGAPWPVARRLWRAKLERIAGRFIAEETARQSQGKPVAIEGSGALRFPSIDFTLTAKADRIDRLDHGGLVIYDYKTGSIPTDKQVRQYDKQLLLEAIIAEAGGFRELPPERVEFAAYIGLGSKDGTHVIDLSDPKFELSTVAGKFSELIRAYDDEAQGYTSRRAMERDDHTGDYDHLARFGEWDGSLPARPEDVR